MLKWVIFSTIWGVGGSMNLRARTEFSEEVRNWGDVEMPPVSPGSALIDYEARVEDQ